MAKKIIIQTSAAPATPGAFSQAVGYGGLLFVSAQVGVDPHTGDLVSGGVEAQTRQTMRNVRAILDAAGLDLSHVLRSTIHLKNMSDHHSVNAVYGGFFDENPPARTCMEVSRLPGEALVQIECVVAAPAREPQPEDGDGVDASPIITDTAPPSLDARGEEE